MLVNIIDRALLRLKRYPDRGELYYEILTKQFIYRFNSTEKELLEELNIERSVFYDRKREAIYLFSVCLFGYILWCMITQMKTENADSVGKPSAQMQKQNNEKSKMSMSRTLEPSLFLRQRP